MIVTLRLQVVVVVLVGTMAKPIRIAQQDGEVHRNIRVAVVADVIITFLLIITVVRVVPV
tara:strand:+ start:281 stop:460 length:180 start_codon:yes stop_codon:yes gene_type:complete